jgi:hypothetical protein
MADQEPEKPEVPAPDLQEQAASARQEKYAIADALEDEARELEAEASRKRGDAATIRAEAGGGTQPI